MCLGDTKGANVTGMLKNSLRADFGAMHRQLICRISYRTVCKINTVNAVCRWGNRSSEMTRFAKRESNGTGNNAFQINFISMVYCDCFGISLLQPNNCGVPREALQRNSLYIQAILLPNFLLCLYMMIFFVFMSLTKPILKGQILGACFQGNIFDLINYVVALAFLKLRTLSALGMQLKIVLLFSALCLLSKIKCSCGLSGSQEWQYATLQLQLAGLETSQLVFTNFLPSGDDNASLRCPAHAGSWEVTYFVSAVFSPFEPFCKGHKTAT